MNDKKTVHLEPEVYELLKAYCGKTRKIAATVNELLAEALKQRGKK